MSNLDPTNADALPEGKVRTECVLEEERGIEAERAEEERRRGPCAEKNKTTQITLLLGRSEGRLVSELEMLLSHYHKEEESGHVLRE